MNFDEYAGFERANGTEAVKTDGVWWRCVRPFFYQPLFPFQELAPHARRAPDSAYLGGFQHVVPDFSMANSRKHFFVWDDIHNYSLQGIEHRRRNSIKRGLKVFSVQEVVDPAEFVSGGHPVYCSFYARTKYPYKKERVDRNCFAQWARCLYRFPKVKILGAYQKGELAGISISYLVQDVLMEATCFSRTESLSSHVYDVLAHEIRERAARRRDISFICRGAVTGEKRLDDAKLQKGCKVFSKPAFYRMNPLAGLVLRSFMRHTYKKLIGSLDADLFNQRPAIRPMLP